jgi:integrase
VSGNSFYSARKPIVVKQHTLGHIDCPACERARLNTLALITPTLPFSVAAAVWLDSRSFHLPGAIRARYIRETTETSYRQYVSTLNLFFGDLPLNKIHLGHLREYQEARVTGTAPFIRYRRPQDAKPTKGPDGAMRPAKGKQPCPAAPKKADQELSILKMILRRAGCWTLEMDEFYQPFEQRPAEVPRALTPDEQALWLEVARFRPRWHLIYWYSVLAFETSMSTNEIRALQIGDVDMQHRIVSVSAAGAKNSYRQRTIPLYSAQVLWACEQLLSRAADLGSRAPQHYLFPFRKMPNPHDPTKPMGVSGIKRLWEEVRDASGIKWFRPYDTRHTAITRWAEAGIPPETIRGMAGHVSERMMLHYTHISNQAKRKAMESMIPRVGPQAASAPFYVARNA